MEVVFGLLLMLLGVSHAVETHCDGRRDGAECYAAVGGTVFIQLMDKVPSRFTFQNSKTTILRSKNQQLFNVMKNRSSFESTNGTFRINNLHKNDSDKYSLEIQNSDGVLEEKRTLLLSIQAPLSSVRLVNDCLSQGEQRVSCSTEAGDSPQYSWTLGGHTLTQDKLLSGNNETAIITLRQNVIGLLVCSVSNHVSLVSKDMMISTCGFTFINCTLSNGTHITQWVSAANKILCDEPTTVTDTTAGKRTESVTLINNITSFNQTVTASSGDDPWFITNFPVMAGVLSALVLLLVLGVAIIYTHTKKKKSATENEGQEELTYADVTVMQRRQVQQRNEEEVEYGQVRFSERPRRAVEQTTENCVYAQVFVNKTRGRLH